MVKIATWLVAAGVLFGGAACGGGASEGSGFKWIGMSGASLASKRAAFDKRGRPPIYLARIPRRAQAPAGSRCKCVTDQTSEG